MKKGTITKNSSATMMKAKASSGSLSSPFKPVKPSAPGSSKRSPRKVIKKQKQILKPQQQQQQNNNNNNSGIVYNDYLTKTLLEGSLGRDTRSSTMSNIEIHITFVLFVYSLCD